MPYKSNQIYTLIRIKKEVLRKLRAVKIHPNQSDSEKIEELITKNKSGARGGEISATCPKIK
jgi:predicted CopG family antitoxin